MSPLIVNTINHIILTIALMALTMLICFPSKMNLLPEDCITILAQPGEIPYHASIQFNGKHHCSGSLIDSKHVLTAAHCVDNTIADNLPDARMKVVVGTRKLPSGIICDVLKVFRHSSYHPMSKEGDIAIVRLKNEVAESRYVQIINLPKLEQKLDAGQKLIVSSFGPTRVPQPISWNLKKITMKVSSNENCEKYFPYQFSFQIFCAVLPRGYAACQTEGGSPATLNRKYVIGVFSDVSRDGCHSGFPELFTYVPYYVNFIKNVTSTQN